MAAMHDEVRPVSSFGQTTYASATAAAAAALLQRPKTAPGGTGSPTPRPLDPDSPAHAVIKKIQTYVFPRRVRAKDRFGDFDPLHSGRCTQPQFCRVVKAIMPSVGPEEMVTLAEHFSQEGAPYPQVVDYRSFVRSVDDVFSLSDLEKTPGTSVPKPGSILGDGLQRDTPALDPEEAGDEDHFTDLLHYIALLVHTRGVVLRACFQDCERSDATSLVTPRFSGKVTAAQFRKRFPFIDDISELDLELLVNRYSTKAGSVHYLALDRDVSALQVPPPLFAQGAMPPISSRDNTFRTMRMRPEKDVSGKSVMQRVKMFVQERRLRIADKFRDFDRLRRGVCTFAQVNTVFSICSIELDRNELDALKGLYRDERGAFRYCDFIEDLMDPIASLDEASPAPSPYPVVATPRRAPISAAAVAQTPKVPGWTSPTAPGAATPCSPMSARGAFGTGILGGFRGSDVEAALTELEASIRKRVQQRCLPLKRSFGDFDRGRSGRVTRLQFERILSMLGLELSTSELDMLAQAYSDTKHPWAFRYFDFCAAVEIRAECTSWNPPQQQSTYFNKGGITGKVVPLRLAGGFVPSRPCTR